MKILFICKALDSPTTRYRVTPLATELEALGHRVFFADDDLFGMLFRRQYDVAFVQRRLLGGPLLKLLRLRVTRLVFDFDDAIFLKSDGEPSASRGKKFTRVAGVADLVLAGNEFLAEHARQYSDNVVVIPTPVDGSRYGQQVDKESVPTLVWIGSQSTARYLHVHTEMFEWLGETYPGLRLKVISDFQYGLNHMEVINIPWSEAVEVSELLSSHIGVAPMIDNAWTRGKCALKVIQYMAAGLPVVSSKVGANSEVVEDGVTGWLVDSPEAWVSAVGTLLDDPVGANQMGQRGRARMLEHYDSAIITKTLLTLINELDQGSSD